MKKISIIGSGQVGSHVAYLLASLDLCDEIVMMDYFFDMAKARALDISWGLRGKNSPINIKASKDYEDIANSDIVVISAGSPRKEGMSRDDLLMQNAKISQQIAQQIASFSPNAIIIQVANPLEITTYTTYKFSGFHRNKVIGMAGLLDGSRMKTAIHERFREAKDVEAFVIGSHNDEMCLLFSQSKVDKIPLLDLAKDEDLEYISTKTKHAGANFVSLASSSAYFAPAACVVEMIKEIFFPTNRIICACAYLKGEYDLDNLTYGVPLRLGKNGIEEIVKLPLNAKEKEQFLNSSFNIKKSIEFVDKNF